MIFRSCSFEKEVQQALKDGHWPQGCAPELRAHVESCRDCSDLVLVTQTFCQARSQSAAEPLLDSPSLLWWRAQLRRRYSATESVTRPVTIAQTFALAINLLVAIVFIAWNYHYGLRWATWWSELMPRRVLQLLMSTSVKPDWNPVLLILTLGALAVLSGLLLYLASEKS
jgi:hypothetical protein